MNKTTIIREHLFIMRLISGIRKNYVFFFILIEVYLIESGE